MTQRAESSPAYSWERLRLGLDQLLRALQVLHAAGLVHRDIKPANVLVTARERVVLLDFGLMHAADADPQRPRRLAGTPAYMAPEQALGGAVTPAADLYAVGALLYEVLTGAPPFVGTGGSPLEHKVHRSPPHVLSLAPHAPEDLSTLARYSTGVSDKRRGLAINFAPPASIRGCGTSTVMPRATTCGSEKT
jgi:serine/threonine protein kinase